jgi:Uma2 family endonuclease
MRGREAGIPRLIQRNAMMATTRLYTVEDVEQSPPEGEWELIDGELVPVSPASLRSAAATQRIGRFIGSYVEDHDLGLVTSAEGGFVIFPDRQTLLAPDVGFIRKHRVPPEEEHDRFPRLAPDLAVEVLSPSARMASALGKVSMYLEAGVELVWLVDPVKRTVIVFAGEENPVMLGEDDILEGGNVLPGFSIRVADLLGTRKSR